MANESVTKSKLFQKALRKLDGTASFNKAGKKYSSNLTKKINKMNENKAAAREILKGVGDDGKLTKDQVKKIKKLGIGKGERFDDLESLSSHAKTYNEKIDSLKEELSGLGDNPYENASIAGKASIIGNTIKDYYNPKGQARSTMALRYGVAAGAYAGVAVGTRLLDGGTLTRNSDGESDIAGIPFI